MALAIRVAILSSLCLKASAVSHLKWHAHIADLHSRRSLLAGFLGNDPTTSERYRACTRSHMYRNKLPRKRGVSPAKPRADHCEPARTKEPEWAKWKTRGSTNADDSRETCPTETHAHVGPTFCRTLLFPLSWRHSATHTHTQSGIGIAKTRRARSRTRARACS